MRVYVLDLPGKGREQILRWLRESERVSEAGAFDGCAEFIEEVEKSPPDLCIIRLGSDTVPGLKAASEVHRIDSRIRVVFISDGPDYAVDAYEVGAYGYLLYPVSRKKLEQCLDVGEE